MGLAFEIDAYSPDKIAERVQRVGLAKARMPCLPLVMLGMLAGAFIGLGSLYYVVVLSDPGIGFATNLVPVIAGNLVGSSVMVALVYHVIYRQSGSLEGTGARGTERSVLKA